MEVELEHKRRDIKEEDLPVKNRIRGYHEWKHLPMSAIHFPDRLEKVEEFSFEPQDVLVWSFPKCGTHFAAGLCYSIMQAAGNPFINPVPYDVEIGDEKPELNGVSPKLLATHLPWPLLPRQARKGKVKMVMITRNPKDVVCGFYPFLKHPVHFTTPTLHPPETTMDEFLDVYLAGKSVYGEQLDWMKKWYPHRSEKQLHNVHFEDLKNDTRSCVIKLSTHLGVSLTDEQISSVIEENLFENKKAKVEADPFLNILFRKGEAGSWKTELTEEQNQRLDLWISEKSELKDFRFKY